MVTKEQEARLRQLLQGLANGGIQVGPSEDDAQALEVRFTTSLLTIQMDMTATENMGLHDLFAGVYLAVAEQAGSTLELERMALGNAATTHRFSLVSAAMPANPLEAKLTHAAHELSVLGEDSTSYQDFLKRVAAFAAN